VAVDMSMQTASDMKVKDEEPVEVDSSAPSSPDSYSEDSDNYTPLVKGKVGQNGRRGLHECIGPKRCTHLTAILQGHTTQKFRSHPDDCASRFPPTTLGL